MTNEKERIAFERTIDTFEAQLANAGTHLTLDASARQAYSREIRKMADRLRNDALSGKITWAQAAQQAKSHAIWSWKLFAVAVHLLAVQWHRD